MNSSAAVGASTAARVVQTSCSVVPPTSSPAQARGAPEPLEVFRARCDARAHLFVSGVIDLHEAVDELQASAERSGLVDLIGQDQVQAIMGAASAHRRWPAPDELPSEQNKVSPPQRGYRTPSSTIDSFWEVVRLDDPNSAQDLVA